MNGYILESRSILESEIWEKPPIYFKIWHYMLLKAKYKDEGHLKRGQLFTTISELADACKYKTGFRVVRPSRKEVWNVLEWLRNPHEGDNEKDMKGTMIETMKVTHGILVTICNFNLYQSPSFYEGNNEGDNEEDMKGTTKGTEGAQYYKEIKKKNNKKNIHTGSPADSRRVDDLMESYNNICISLPKAVKMTDTRRTHLKARLKEHTEADIRLAFIKAEESDFLSGRRSDWHADFDWIIKSENNLVKILEGHYDNRDVIKESVENDLANIYAGMDPEKIKKAQEVMQ